MIRRYPFYVKSGHVREAGTERRWRDGASTVYKTRARCWHPKHSHPQCWHGAPSHMGGQHVPHNSITVLASYPVSCGGLAPWVSSGPDGSINWTGTACRRLQPTYYCDWPYWCSILGGLDRLRFCMITHTLFEIKVTDVENSQIGRNIESMFVNVLYLILKVN